MKKIIENYFFQFIFQFCKLVIPFITIPWVSRVLGAENIGIYNFTNSIVQYVVIFSGLGISLYGSKEIAKNKDDKEKMSEIFWTLTYLKFISTSIFGIIFIIISRNSNYVDIYIIQFLIVLSVGVDVSWFFMGIEEFKKISLISLGIQISTLFCIFRFVIDKGDLLIYILIQSVGMLLSQLVVWIFVKKKVNFIFPNFLHIKEAFFASIPYFVPQIAVLLYSNLNKTMLGFFAVKEDVAFYSNAQTIINMIVVLITTLDTVLLPRISYMSINNSKEEVINILDKTIHFQFFVTIGCFFGLNSIIPLFVPWFFGSEFIPLIQILSILSILIIIIPLGMSISRQYLLPYGKIHLYNKSIIQGSIISLLIGSLTMWKFGIISAIVANISAELFVTVTRTMNFLKTEIFKFRINYIMKCVVSGIIMYSINIIISIYFNLGANPLTTIVLVITGIIVYLLFGFVFKINPIINLFRKNME